MQVSSRHLVERAAEIGIHPAKSKTVRMPDVPQEVLGHFLRGVFDGDGCVRDSSDKRRNEKPRLSMQIASGSHEFRADLMKTLLNVGFGSRESGIEVVLSHKESEKFAAWLWQDKEKSIWMDRKYDRYCEIMKAREGWKK